MSGDHGEIWDYIMATREEAAAAEERIKQLKGLAHGHGGAS